MSNVVKGPWGTVAQPRVPLSEDEKNALMIQAFVEELTEALFIGIREAGFDNLEEICYYKDLSLIVESIRSYLFKLQERWHPAQEVAECMFGLNEDGTLYTNESIQVDFNDHP